MRLPSPPGQWDGEFQQGVALCRGPGARVSPRRWGFPFHSLLPRRPPTYDPAETRGYRASPSRAALGVMGHTTAAGRAVARAMWQVRPCQHDARSLFLPKFSVS